MKQVKVKIDNKGNYTTEMIGYEGTSCATASQKLEVLLGGEVIGEKKKPEYYEGDGDNPVEVKF